jgi:hypothetical protein
MRSWARAPEDVGLLPVAVAVCESDCMRIVCVCVYMSKCVRMILSECVCECMYVCTYVCVCCEHVCV